MTINDYITNAFGGDDVPDKLNEIVNRILKLEDGGSGTITNQDAMTKLIEGDSGCNGLDDLALRLCPFGALHTLQLGCNPVPDSLSKGCNPLALQK